jgi:hypothetical protein
VRCTCAYPRIAANEHWKTVASISLLWKPVCFAPVIPPNILDYVAGTNRYFDSKGKKEPQFLHTSTYIQFSKITLLFVRYFGKVDWSAFESWLNAIEPLSRGLKHFLMYSSTNFSTWTQSVHTSNGLLGKRCTNSTVFKNNPHQHSECYTSSTEEQEPTPIRIRLEYIHVHTEQAL